ncbi:glycosyltransferase family 4 protein [Fodinibius sp. AD559]|uniref:glycosyltransferase family 4 protein n=1 Tax=Fodinibius sp. AD559 TaxID=3424179 RepID=UPI004046AFC6
MNFNKIAFLSSRLSGYMSACLKTLKEKYDVKLLVYSWPQSPNAPFDEETFQFIDHHYIKENDDYSQILERLIKFDPDTILTSGWIDSDYLKACRRIKGNGIPVIAGSDTQFENTFRQKAAQWIAPFYLHSAIDVLWVSGERQRQLAYKLGYTDQNCLDGFYSCDWEKFAEYKNVDKSQRAFIYVGRYIDRKGIPQLIDAYKQYCEEVKDPWKLVCAGKGPLGKELDRVNGIENRGFTQPDELPELMTEASAFVLPSLKEPWGVVVHEAAATGLPLICSSACGVTTALLRDRYNGYLVEPGNTSHLVNKMKTMHQLSDKEYGKMSKRSFELSKQLTPHLWADTLIEGIKEFKQN